jgi:hypothetical protein
VVVEGEEPLDQLWEEAAGLQKAFAFLEVVGS